MAIHTVMTETEPVPHEPGETMTFRRLGWKALKEAREGRARRQMQSASDLARGLDADFLKQMRDEVAAAVTARGDAAIAPEADPLDDYDKDELLRRGIAAWSYDAPVTPENLDGLDEATADWAARRVLALSTPATGDARKNS